MEMGSSGMIDKFDCISPTDFRYSVKKLEPYLSEDAFTKYKVKVEAALVKTLAKNKICSQKVAQELENIVNNNSIITQMVYEEEDRIKHDIRALVNVMKQYVSDEAKPFIHFAATSYDIVDTAKALMYKDAAKNVILPDMIELEKTWIDLAMREKDTIQVGRTHGQHAEPITFGFAIAQYVNRFGDRIVQLEKAADNLVGKFSGAVGAYNASSLLISDPEFFEKELLEELGLKPAKISTQIVPPEQNLDFMHSIVSAFGVLANYADDMRHLQRTEIAEVGEPFGKEQVGSSTMPQKRNPINFENIKSAWKEFMPRIVTMYMDQISEHQRDLTNSLSQRYVPELMVMFDSSVERANKISKKLTVDQKNMEKNFMIGADKLIAEPLQILLSSYGHPNAHEKVRQLTMESYKQNTNLTKIVMKDDELKGYLAKFTQKQLELISDPKKYVGRASKKTESTCREWADILNLVSE